MVIEGNLTNPSRIVVWYRSGETKELVPEGQEDTSSRRCGSGCA